MSIINIDNLHVRVETVCPHDLDIGDIVWQHGARMRILTKDNAPSPHDPRGVTLCHTEMLNGGGNIPEPWRKDWQIQGNSSHKLTREIMSIPAEYSSVYTDERGNPYN